MIDISPKTFIAPILGALSGLSFTVALVMTLLIAFGVISISWGIPIFLAVLGVVFLISSYTVAYFAARAFMRDVDSRMDSKFTSLNRRNG